jgi:hypothetical protein
VLKELQMKTLPVAKIAKNLVEFTAPIILEQKANTRRCFYAELACDVDGVWNLRGDIIHERKGKDGWLPLDGPKLSQLKSGEISKLELRTEHLKKFIVGLQVLKGLAGLSADARKAALDRFPVAQTAP